MYKNVVLPLQVIYMLYIIYFIMNQIACLNEKRKKKQQQIIIQTQTKLLHIIKLET